MRKAVSLFILVAVAITALPGCVSQKEYRPTKLKPIRTEQSDFEQTKEQVTLRVKKFSQADCTKMFDYPGKKLLDGKKSVNPMQLCLDNQSAIDWQLEEENISINLASPSKAFENLKNVNDWSYCPYIVGELVFLFPILWPLYIFGFPFTIKSSSIELGESNERIRNDLLEKSFSGLLALPSKKTLSTLVFVENQNMEDIFTITLTNPAKDTEKLTFTIALA